MKRAEFGSLQIVHAAYMPTDRIARRGVARDIPVDYSFDAEIIARIGAVGHPLFLMGPRFTIRPCLSDRAIIQRRALGWEAVRLRRHHAETVLRI